MWLCKDLGFKVAKAIFPHHHQLQGIIHCVWPKQFLWISESRPWDHKIELKETFIPKSFKRIKTYNLTPGRTIRVGQIPERQFRERLYSAIPINNGLTIISLSTKRTESFDLVRIIDISMNTQSRMPIHCL
jgi:hypothetical protein